MRSSEKINTQIFFRGTAFGLTAAIIVSAVLLLLFALLMASAGLPLVSADWFSLLALCFGSLVGGIVSALFVKSKGMVIGAVCGGILAALWLLVSVLMCGVNWSVFGAFKLLGSIVCGTIGGVIGVNRKERRIKY